MAKNFTDFQELTGYYVDPLPNTCECETGTKVSEATRDMHVVGYDQDEPHGERQFTINSILLNADATDVGLQNVDNESKKYMFDNSNLTGHTSADDLTVRGDLSVLGEATTLLTETFATSSFDIHSGSLGSLPALTVTQDAEQPLVVFSDGEDIAFHIADGAWSGFGCAGHAPNRVTIAGQLSASGDIMVDGAVDGRYLGSQDGPKLDNIQYYADVTSVMLSSVSERLTELADTDNWAGIAVQKGMDLLEDGDHYKKVPALSGVAAPGITDYSMQKIKSVEYEADVTGDHSADIILNDVPDGPYTGDKDTTFVKMTSAQLERSTSIRGVAQDLYSGDDGADISEQHIRDAYQNAYPDYWSTANETEYRGTVVHAATAAVHNVGGYGESLSNGHARLSHVEITTSLQAENAKLGSTVSVLSAGEWRQGLTKDIDVGGTTLRFVDGLLVDSWDSHNE